MTSFSFEAWMNQSNAGFWEYDVNTNQVQWSNGFYNLLGYVPDEIECSYQNFIEYLLYYEDLDLFLKSINRQDAKELHNIEIRLLTSRGYEWFQSTMQKQKNGRITGTLFSIHAFKIAEVQSSAQNRLAAENNQLLQIGNWTLDCSSGEDAVSGSALPVLDIREESISLNSFLNIFEPFNRNDLKLAISACKIYGNPFQLELLVRPPYRREKWVKIKARGRIDHLGACIEINGIIQNIDSAKTNETELKRLVNEVTRQKDALQNFAHIVAHNINSHANNLKVLVDMFEQTPVKEREEIFSKIKGLSANLVTTISNLNELINSESTTEIRSFVEFEQVLQHTIENLQDNIRLAEAEIVSDFSECTHIEYIPAYLESIFHNMISNALKYRSPERKPNIVCTSKKVNDTVFLIFEDNGIGIDLPKYGHQLFGMFKTFHLNTDARGLGLYITRNQVEQAGGAISVESELNKGTKFTIRLNALS